jgi:hypothetical protein
VCRQQLSVQQMSQVTAQYRACLVSVRCESCLGARVGGGGLVAGGGGVWVTAQNRACLLIVRFE